MRKMANKNKKNQHKSEFVNNVEEERIDKITLTGTVSDSAPGATFKVELDPEHGGAKIVATLAGKLRQNKIRILVGDRVKVEVSPYDLTRGRICWRT